MKKTLFLATLLFTVALSFLTAHDAYAATLRLNPDTGVYTVGAPFSVSVLLNTNGKPVNASDGSLSFNPRELSVLSVTRSSSIFNLWTEEPKFSNAAGTVSFGGGSPSGYTGASGIIMTVTFKALGAGTPKVTFKSGSVLAADGMGTNVLTAMTGGTYTIAAASAAPEPEYIAPANTPKAPGVTSSTHPDEAAWYKEKTASLAWQIPSGVTGVRTLLDKNAGTVPTIVYDKLITEKTIDDLPEGISYFHIQFKNADGWGKITHYRLAVDTEAPSSFTISEDQNGDTTNPARVLSFAIEDISPILLYKIQIDGKDPIEYKDIDNTKKYTLDSLAPGYHTVVVEAFDSAGNSAVANYSFTIAAFEKPVFTEYPTRINTEVIPAIKGTTRPRAQVTIKITRAGDGISIQSAQGDEGQGPYTVTSDDNGEFTFIPNASFAQGVYVLQAVATDAYGAVSEPSDEIKIIVETPGYIAIGTMVISILSVIIPLTALLFLMIFGSWYLWHKLALWRKRVRKETVEAEEKLTLEFNEIVKNLNEKVSELKVSRKGKLTKAELALIEQMEQDLAVARQRISKEIVDIENIIT